LISDISNHKGGEDTSEIETNLENKLGEPDSVTYYYEDGLFVEKSAWKQASGLVIRTIKQKNHLMVKSFSTRTINKRTIRNRHY
jgi:hypothetical protein